MKDEDAKRLEVIRRKAIEVEAGARNLGQLASQLASLCGDAPVGPDPPASPAKTKRGPGISIRQIDLS
jgi:hypothetical protein